MTEIEAKKIIAVMMVTFSNYKPIDVALAATTWANATAEYSYAQVNAALKMYISSDLSGFAPTPGKIIALIQTASKPQELSETEAWTLVARALRNSTYNSESEFAKLPPLVQKAVGDSKQLETWATLENYNENVISSNFMRVYRTEVTRANDISRMPVRIQEHIAKINVGRMPEIAQSETNLIEDTTDREWQPMSEEAQKALEKLKGRMKSYESG